MKKIIAFVLAASMLLSGCGATTADAIGNKSDKEKEKMLTFNVDGATMQIEVCAADIIRVQFFPGGEVAQPGINTFTVDYNKDFNDYEVTESDGSLNVTTSRIRMEVNTATGKIKYYDALNGELILAEKDRSYNDITLDNNEKSYEVSQEFISDENEALYGFGNINGVMGIKGQSINIAQLNTEKRTPMFYSNMGYGILFDITSNGRLDWLDENTAYRYTGFASDRMDYFFFYGPDADEVISGYRTVTGQATMLPKRAFGYIQSRNRYTSQAELEGILDTFREKQIPIDGLVIDYFWWNGSFNDITNWGSSWTDPEAMMRYLHDNHVGCSISVWPSFEKDTEAYSEMDSAGGIIHSDTPFFGYVYDASSPEGRDKYWQLINDNVFTKGLDSIWLDACEPEFSSWASNSSSENIYAGNSKPIGALFPLLTNQGVYEHQREIKKNTKRVNTLSRGSTAGLQRYGAQSWSGDIPSTWESLTAEVAGIVNYSAAGLPYFGTDIGGYHGFNNDSEDAREMYLRWIQLGTFMTIMRSHGANNPREPWQFGSVYEDYITDFIYLRERLIPYIYSLVGAVTQDDYTIIRPLIFDFRTDDNVKHISDQYMFGPALMVAPVTACGQRSRDVYLPAGTWTDFWSGKTIESKGETVTVDAPLSQIPLFVKGGSIIPMGPRNQYVDENQDPTEIRVYAGADGEFTLYEDAGDGYDYESGEFSNIPFTYDDHSKTLTIGKRTGKFDGMLKKRTFNIVFVQPGYGIGGYVSSDYQPSAVVKYDGSEVSVTFDADWEIPTPPLDLDTLPAPESAPAVKTSDHAMVGYWPFSEGEGARVSDLSGLYNNGGLNTSDWTSAGKEGSAIKFSGERTDSEGTYVSVPHSLSLDISNQISFSAWIKNDSEGHANIVNKGGNGSNNPGFSFILLNGSDLQLEIQSPADSGNITQKTTAVSKTKIQRDGKWHQVGFSWKSTESGGDGIVRIYVDGVQTSDDGNPSNYFEGPVGLNKYPLIIGRSCENEPAFPNYFKGVIDEVRLFNYCISSEDMLALTSGQDIVSENVSNASAISGDRSLAIKWNDAPSTEKVKVTIESADTESDSYIKKTYEVEKGKQSLTVDGLENYEYYHINIISVEADGSEASGINIIAQASKYMAEIDSDYVVTHGNGIYAWLENLSSEIISGTVKVTLTENGTVKETLTDDVSVEGNGRLRIVEELKTDYAPGQEIILEFTATDGSILSAPASKLRTNVYYED